MDLSCGGSVSGDDHDETSHSRKGKKPSHRHSAYQIRHLEAFFKKQPHPDENQRRQLSRELGLEPKQIKFWFQNKRTQTKARIEKADNNALRIENEKIHCENLALRETLKNIICPKCDGPALGEEERQLSVQKMQMENARLKEEFALQHERLSSLVSSLAAKSDPNFQSLTHVMESLKSFSEGSISSQLIGEGPILNPEQVLAKSNVKLDYQFNGIQEMEKSTIIETGLNSMNELLELFRINEPLWIKSSNDGIYHLHRDSYDKLFPKTNRFKSSTARVESSKDSGVVAMPALKLVDMFMDADKWMETFPTIVTKASIVEVLETGSFIGSMYLMHERVHILSPLVAPREFLFIRYCRQLDSTTWAMVDVSYDSFKELHDASTSRSWRLPSGCMIQDLLNGSSKVTWIEHVQVDDKSLTHRLYRDLVCGSQAYGAARWIVTLQRTCERIAYSIRPTNTTTDELERVIDGPEGKKNAMKLSHRMMKNFCEALSAADKLDFPHLSEMNISGVRISVRKNEGPGQPKGVIVSVATSLRLPLSCENLFNFLKDEKERAKWDVLSNKNPVNEIARISTGSFLGNCISVIQPFVPKEHNMLILQESNIDILGAHIIYAPIDLPCLTSAINGEDTTRIPILPSGFVISGDGRSSSHHHHSKATAAAASTSASASASASASSSRPPGGSLLTVAFQILACCNTGSKQLNMESVATVHTLISSTIQNIKAALDCSDLD